MYNYNYYTITILLYYTYCEVVCVTQIQCRYMMCCLVYMCANPQSSIPYMCMHSEIYL